MFGDYRRFLLFVWIAGASMLMAPLVGRAAAAADGSPRRPNIIVSLADDLGYTDLGCYGCKDYPTPHVDSLAKNGQESTLRPRGRPRIEGNADESDKYTCLSPLIFFESPEVTRSV